ncbi:MAG: hypothetical protein ACHQXA_05970 [Gemmatimonadales bacterium]
MANEWRAIGRYARQLRRHFARLRPDLRFTLYAERPEKLAAPRGRSEAGWCGIRIVVR